MKTNYFYNFGKNKLSPIFKSISGIGIRKTLNLIKNEFPDFAECPQANVFGALRRHSGALRKPPNTFGGTPRGTPRAGGPPRASEKLNWRNQNLNGTHKNDPGALRGPSGRPKGPNGLLRSQPLSGSLALDRSTPLNAFKRH